MASYRDEDKPPPLYMGDIYELVKELKSEYNRRDQLVFDRAVRMARALDRGHEHEYGPLARYDRQIEERVELVRQTVNDMIRRIHKEARTR